MKLKDFMNLSEKERATILTGVDDLVFNIAAKAEDFLDTLAADVKSGDKTVIKGELVFQKDNPDYEIYQFVVKTK
ncbi:hypothetical protein JGC56_08190 [Salmonella enterica subsp. enterica serovar Saintpaul]|nr:hypothetical protein [Salmonella enterica subsp. enterica serovar Saintpaul]